MAVSLPEQIQAVRRELGQRRRVYGRLVENGRMTQAKADHEIAAMEAVLATVEAAERKALAALDQNLAAHEHHLPAPKEES